MKFVTKAPNNLRFIVFSIHLSLKRGSLCDSGIKHSIRAILGLRPKQVSLEPPFPRYCQLQGKPLPFWSLPKHLQSS